VIPACENYGQESGIDQIALDSQADLRYKNDYGLSNLVMLDKACKGATRLPPDPTKVKKLETEIENLKKLCKECTAAGDKEVCTPALQKKAASGKHGQKDNATKKQVREGLQERIDQLKRDLEKEKAKKKKLCDWGGSEFTRRFLASTAHR